MDKFYNSFALIEFLLQQKVHTVTSHNETRRLGYDNYKAQKNVVVGKQEQVRKPVCNEDYHRHMSLRQTVVVILAEVPLDLKEPTSTYHM